MAAQKHLEAKEKGEFSYDFKYDVLYFKVKDRTYKQSVEFQNFVADIDDEDFVTGLRVFDASRVFGIDKQALRNITYMEFESHVENNVITIRCRFVCKMLNKTVPEQFTQQLTQTAPMELADSSTGPIAATAG